MTVEMYLLTAPVRSSGGAHLPDGIDTETNDSLGMIDVVVRIAQRAELGPEGLPDTGLAFDPASSLALAACLIMVGAAVILRARRNRPINSQ